MKLWLPVVLVILGLLIGIGHLTRPLEGTNQVVEDSLDNFRVTKLFKKDDCNVYRFRDRGEYHYFTDCSETLSKKSYTCGKTRCYKEENVKSK